MSAKRKFPVEIWRGSVVVRVFKNAPQSGYASYTLTYYLDGIRRRKCYSDLNRALRQAEAMANKLSNGELSALTLRDADRAAYIRAQEFLRPTGVGIETAAWQYAEASGLLKGVPLLEACHFFRKHHLFTGQSKAIAEIVAELLQHKAKKLRSAKYLKQLRSDLKRFAAAYKCPLSTITSTEIEHYLETLKLAPRTVNNHRASIGTLFSYAIARKYVAKDHPGISEIEQMTVEQREVEIFTVAEMTALLAAARSEIVPYLTVRAFSGVRDAELGRLGWEQVKITEGHIEIPHRSAKTKIRRLAPILPNLRAWLLPYQRESGPIAPFEKMSSQLQIVAEAAGIRWKHNGLRDSFISYRIAFTGDVSRTAHESGNSPQTIYRSYLKAVSKAEAEKWFSILPTEPAEVVAFPRSYAAS